MSHSPWAVNDGDAHAAAGAASWYNKLRVDDGVSFEQAQEWRHNAIVAMQQAGIGAARIEQSAFYKSKTDR